MTKAKKRAASKGGSGRGFTTIVVYQLDPERDDGPLHRRGTIERQIRIEHWPWCKTIESVVGSRTVETVQVMDGVRCVVRERVGAGWWDGYGQWHDPEDGPELYVVLPAGRLPSDRSFVCSQCGRGGEP